MKHSSFHAVETNADAAARHMMLRSHNRDGLPEIAIGLGFLTVAFLIGLQVVYPPGTFLYRASALGMALLIPAEGLAALWAIKWMRRKYWIETLGYVQLKPLKRTFVLLVLAIAILTSAAMTFSVYKGPLPPASWLLAASGIFGGVLAAYAGRLPRYVAGGAGMAALGIALAFSRVSLEKGSLILYGSIGMLSLLSGCVGLTLFLRTRHEASE